MAKKKADGRGVLTGSTSDGLDRIPTPSSKQNPNPSTKIISGGIKNRKKKGST